MGGYYLLQNDRMPEKNYHTERRIRGCAGCSRVEEPFHNNGSSNTSNHNNTHNSSPDSVPVVGVYGKLRGFVF